MTSSELAAEIQEFIDLIKGRIVGIGREQYEDWRDDSATQKFEVMDLGELFDGSIEELADQVSYCIMLAIRIRRLKAALCGEGVTE